MYFFVTDLRELEKQPLLREQLSRYPIIAEDHFFTLYSIEELPQP
jgi:hypothetical protein